MRTPPQSSRTPWNKAVCQGCEWASHSWPPSTLDSCALKCPAAGGREFGLPPPWGSAEARKTHCGFRHTACLCTSPYWDCEAPSLHRLPHRCTHIRSLKPVSHTESHTRACFHMLPHASTCSVYCAYRHPSASSPAGLVCSCNMQHNLTHSYRLPCVHASIHPQQSPKKFSHVFACFISSRMPSQAPDTAFPQAPARPPLPAQASNSKSRNIQVQTTADGGCPMVGSGRGRRQG